MDKQLSIKELRGAAHHEAGHKIICECFGVTAEAIVFRNGSGIPDTPEWLGKCWLLKSPRRNPAVKRPANWTVLVGMAGLLAEIIESGETDDASAIADIFIETVKCEGASQTDFEQMGVHDIDNFKWSYKVIEKTVRLLQQNWQAVEQEAERLIESVADQLDRNERLELSRRSGTSIAVPGVLNHQQPEPSLQSVYAHSKR